MLVSPRYQGRHFIIIGSRRVASINLALYGSAYMFVLPEAKLRVVILLPKHDGASTAFLEPREV